jgi:hypothetical protein
MIPDEGALASSRLACADSVAGSCSFPPAASSINVASGGASSSMYEMAEASS